MKQQPVNESNTDKKTEKISRFLEAVTGPEDLGELEVRTIPRESGNAPVASEWFRSAKALAEKIPTFNDPDRHYYFGPGRRHNRDRNDAAVPSLCVVWADVDDDLRREYGREEAFHELQVLGASWITDTGGGMQACWITDRPMPSEDVRRINTLIAKRLAPFGADPKVVNPSRLLRLPGTLNVKPKYGEPRPCEIIYEETDRRYDPKELEKTFGPVRASRARGIEKEASPDLNGNETLPPCLEDALENWPEEAGERHDLALRIASAARKARWSPEEAERRILEAAEAAGDDQQDDRRRAVEDVYQREISCGFGCEDAELRRRYPCRGRECDVFVEFPEEKQREIRELGLEERPDRVEEAKRRRNEAPLRVESTAPNQALMKRLLNRLELRHDLFVFANSVHQLVDGQLIPIEGTSDTSAVAELIEIEVGGKDSEVRFLDDRIAKHLQTHLRKHRRQFPEIDVVRKAPVVVPDGEGGWRLPEPGYHSDWRLLQLGAPCSPRKPGALLDHFRRSTAFASEQEFEHTLAYFASVFFPFEYERLPMFVVYTREKKIGQETGKSFVIRLLSWMLGERKPEHLSPKSLLGGGRDGFRRAVVGAAKAGSVIYFGNILGEGTTTAHLGCDDLSDMLTAPVWSCPGLYAIKQEEIANRHVVAASMSAGEWGRDLAVRIFSVALDPLQVEEAEKFREEKRLDERWWREHVEEFREEILGWALGQLKQNEIPRGVHGHNADWKRLAGRFLGRPVPTCAAVIRSDGGALEKVLQELVEAGGNGLGSEEMAERIRQDRLHVEGFPSSWKDVLSEPRGRALRMGRLLSGLVGSAGRLADGRLLRLEKRVREGRRLYVGVPVDGT